MAKRPDGFPVHTEPRIATAGPNVREVKSFVCHCLVYLTSCKPDMNCPVCGCIFKEGYLVRFRLIIVKILLLGVFFLRVLEFDIGHTELCHYKMRLLNRNRVGEN